MLARKRLLLTLLVSSLFATQCTLPEPASSIVDERETATHLLKSGDEASDRRDFATALQAYRAAHAIARLPTTALEVAKTEVALGQLLEARTTCLGIARIPVRAREHRASLSARETAAAMLDDLRLRIPTVRVVPENAAPSDHFTLLIDDHDIRSSDAPLPQEVNPGEHRVAVITRSYSTIVRHFRVEEGEALVVPVAFDVTKPKVRPPSTYEESDGHGSPSRVSQGHSVFKVLLDLALRRFFH